jgi:VanZ family protein
VKSSTRRLLVLWVPVALYAAAIFAASSMADFNTGPGHWRDKILHTIEYGTFGFICIRAFNATFGNSWRIILYSIACAAFYGITDEFHQRFTPGRTCDYRDWIADVIGITLGTTIYLIGSRIAWRYLERSKRTNNHTTGASKK